MRRNKIFLQTTVAFAPNSAASFYLRPLSEPWITRLVVVCFPEMARLYVLRISKWVFQKMESYRSTRRVVSKNTLVGKNSYLRGRIQFNLFILQGRKWNVSCTCSRSCGLSVRSREHCLHLSSRPLLLFDTRMRGVCVAHSGSDQPCSSAFKINCLCLF